MPVSDICYQHMRLSDAIYVFTTISHWINMLIIASLNLLASHFDMGD